jgi:hypothetical protein
MSSGFEQPAVSIMTSSGRGPLQKTSRVLNKMISFDWKHYNQHWIHVLYTKLAVLNLEILLHTAHGQTSPVVCGPGLSRPGSRPGPTPAACLDWATRAQAASTGRRNSPRKVRPINLVEDPRTDTPLG